MKSKSKRDDKSKSKRSDVVDRSVLQIQKDRLDWECARQPDLYFEYGEKLADARSDFDHAKAALDLTEAELDREIRSKSKEKYGTESAIKARIKRDKRYVAAVEKVQNLKHDVDVLQLFLTALEHKKRMLEKEVDLFGMSYFSEPRVKSASREAIDDMKMRRAKPLDDDDD